MTMRGQSSEVAYAGAPLAPASAPQGVPHMPRRFGMHAGDGAGPCARGRGGRCWGVHEGLSRKTHVWGVVGPPPPLRHGENNFLCQVKTGGAHGSTAPKTHQADEKKRNQGKG